jgi:hypothetical protein
MLERRGIAHGLLAIGAGEGGAARGEGVEMRREGGRAVAAELGTQVVGGDEENIRRRGGGGGDVMNREKKEHGKEAEQGKFHQAGGCRKSRAQGSPFCHGRNER